MVHQRRCPRPRSHIGAEVRARVIRCFTKALGHCSHFYYSSRSSTRAASDWSRKSLLQAAAALDAHQVTAVQLTRACIAQVESTRALNAFVYTDFERALRLAEASDARRATGSALGVLDGIPVGVKDLFCMEGVPTTAASKILDGAGGGKRAGLDVRL